MKAVGVIPARWASTRFEGKVLADIAGKPMIQHVWERTSQCQHLDDVLIATDHEQVLKAAEAFGAKAVLTRVDHPSGSDRVAEAVKDVDTDIVVNIQGDEPLISPQVIDDLVLAISQDKEVVMATVIKQITDANDISNPNVVKAVIDDRGNALYFSRSPIPYNRDQQDITYYKHLGLYAYTKDFLFQFIGFPPSALENAERLEQLRVLEAGYSIRTVITDQETIGVDTKEDLKKVQGIFKTND
ncbi:MAG: 3-deoxy-manno-octulosonate cytidylyltransferase [Candidatus Omnitrophica bacterium]|nr:3-deoxy-manno-octulosonate cytidylyltransferase [Candidatus Omnitrophota bacterium]